MPPYKFSIRLVLHTMADAIFYELEMESQSDT